MLDALDPADRDAFTAHLRRCHRCRGEVATFREAAAALGDLLVTAPPPLLRRRILDAVRTVPQHRPLRLVRAPDGSPTRRPDRPGWAVDP